MRKEGFRGVFNSRNAKVNIALFASILVIFALTMVFYESMSVNAIKMTLITPGNFTFNSTAGRNINFSFNVTWPEKGENASNCTLVMNSTTSGVIFGLEGSVARAIVRNATNGSTGSADPDRNITNLSISYFNYTFAKDGNYTWVIHCYNSSGERDTTSLFNSTPHNFTFFLDASPPVVNFSAAFPDVFNSSTVTTREIRFAINDSVYGVSESAYGLNMSLNLSINLSIYDTSGVKLAFFSYVNQSSVTNLTCTATNPSITKGSVVCNATYTFGNNGNGTYLINVSSIDAADSFRTASNFNTSAIKLTVDQIPPAIITKLNFTNNGSTADGLGSDTLSTVPANGRGTWAQGRRLLGLVNVTDNLTAPIHAYLQFYNVSSSTWITVNSTMDGGLNITPSATNANGTANLTYNIPTGHNLFEGANISFRYIVNDTVGNTNATLNITIQINDTTKPTLIVTVQTNNTLNNSNTSDATPTIFWNITEGNSMRNISIQFDSLTLDSCNERKLFSSIATANLNRNGSLTLLDADVGCTPLANGSHTVTVTAEDTWGNQELYVHQFFVQSGKPGLVFNNITAPSGSTFGSAAQNITNITSPYVGFAFSGLAGAVNVQNLTYVSSCDSSSTVVFTNSTTIYPFNASTCGTSSQSGNVTLKVTVTDNLGNSNSTVFGFLLDNSGPTLTVNSPTDGQQFANLRNISVTVFDSESRVDAVGYYLDGSNTYRNLSSNGSSFPSLTGGFGQQFIFNGSVNFTPGTHTIKITVNDTLGNVRNSSATTFTQTGPVVFSEVTTSIQKYTNLTFNTHLVNVTTKIKAANIFEPVTTTNETSTNTFEITFEINKTINVSLTEINGSAANWDKINVSPNMSNAVLDSRLVINWSNSVIRSVVFNNSLNQFLPDNNSYYGIVVMPGVLNESNTTRSTVQEFWWIKDDSDLSSRENISLCQSAFTRTTTTPCFNYTSGGNSIIQVPHFSIVVAVNDTSAPTVNVTTPGGNTSSSRISNHTVSSFIPNITVSSDAISCSYYLNATSPTNKTMTKSGNICLGSTENVKNLNAVNGYNITFWVIDNNGNTNRYTWGFNMSDTTAPDNGAITSSASDTTATVTITGTNETVNATVNYGTTNTSLSSSATETDFNETQVVSLSGLSESKAYYYNVTVCDFNGNCKTNISTFSFTTSATASTSTTTTTSSSSGGGGGAATPAAGVATVAASTGTSWDTLAAGTSGTVVVKNDKIAVTSIVIDVKNTVTSPSVNVQSYTSNPLTANAAAKVYQYLQLTKSNLADSDASKITISFKVPKSWLTSNNVAENDVVLYRYSDSKWNGLPTSMTGGDANNALYSATTPGFSTFAIGGKEAAPAVTPTTETPAEEAKPAEATGAVTAAAGTEAAPSAPAKKGMSNTVLAWIVVLAIVVVAGIGYFMWQKKRE